MEKGESTRRPNRCAFSCQRLGDAFPYCTVIVCYKQLQTSSYFITIVHVATFSTVVFHSWLMFFRIAHFCLYEIRQHVRHLYMTQLFQPPRCVRRGRMCVRELRVIEQYAGTRNVRVRIEHRNVWPISFILFSFLRARAITRSRSPRSPLRNVFSFRVGLLLMCVHYVLRAPHNRSPRNFPCT